MLRSVLIVAVFLVSPGLVPAQAPKPPTVEVFGGFSYLNFRTYEREHFFDVATGVAVNINKHFALAGDVNLPLSGPSENLFFGILGPPSQVVFPPQYTSRQKTRISTALAGPRFSLRREKMTLFAHALAGVARKKESYEFGECRDRLSSVAYSTNGPAYGVGGGLDLQIGGRYAVRMVQADYLRARVSGWSNQFRLQTGVVVRLGKGSK